MTEKKTTFLSRLGSFAKTLLRAISTAATALTGSSGVPQADSTHVHIRKDRDDRR